MAKQPQDWIAETVDGMVKRFEKTEGPRLVYMAAEIKNAMLVNSALCPTVLRTWEGHDLVELVGRLRTWYN